MNPYLAECKGKAVLDLRWSGVLTTDREVLDHQADQVRQKILSEISKSYFVDAAFWCQCGNEEVKTFEISKTRVISWKADRPILMADCCLWRRDRPDFTLDCYLDFDPAPVGTSRSIGKERLTEILQCPIEIHHHHDPFCAIQHHGTSTTTVAPIGIEPSNGST